jgi:phospholipid-binding lipoprotein MlaA
MERHRRIPMMILAGLFALASPCTGQTAAPSPTGESAAVTPAAGTAETAPATAPAEASESPAEAGEPSDTLADPLEPANRAFFTFNDKAYFWVVKPAATGYKTILPEPVRVGFRNVFSTLGTPVRIVNCLLQGNFKCSGNETARLLINASFGLGGFLDPAKTHFEIEKRDASFGQTLGKWGMGSGAYIHWPVIGPSSVRDSLGFIGDRLMDPRTYLSFVYLPYWAGLGMVVFNGVNEASLTLGTYEDVKNAAIDPYVSVRDGYSQHSQGQIDKK